MSDDPPRKRKAAAAASDGFNTFSSGSISVRAFGAPGSAAEFNTGRVNLCEWSKNLESNSKHMVVAKNGRGGSAGVVLDDKSFDAINSGNSTIQATCFYSKLTMETCKRKNAKGKTRAEQLARSDIVKTLGPELLKSSPSSRVLQAGDVASGLIPPEVLAKAAAMSFQFVPETPDNLLAAAGVLPDPDAPLRRRKRRLRTEAEREEAKERRKKKRSDRVAAAAAAAAAAAEDAENSTSPPPSPKATRKQRKQRKRRRWQKKSAKSAAAATTTTDDGSSKAANYDEEDGDEVIHCGGGGDDSQILGETFPAQDMPDCYEAAKQVVATAPTATATTVQADTLPRPLPSSATSMLYQHAFAAHGMYVRQATAVKRLLRLRKRPISYYYSFKSGGGEKTAV